MTITRTAPSRTSNCGTVWRMMKLLGGSLGQKYPPTPWGNGFIFPVELYDLCQATGKPSKASSWGPTAINTNRSSSFFRASKAIRQTLTDSEVVFQCLHYITEKNCLPSWPFWNPGGFLSPAASCKNSLPLQFWMPLCAARGPKLPVQRPPVATVPMDKNTRPGSEETPKN